MDATNIQFWCKREKTRFLHLFTYLFLWVGLWIVNSETVLRSKQNYKSLLQEKGTRARDAAPLLKCVIQHIVVRDMPTQRNGWKRVLAYTTYMFWKSYFSVTSNSLFEDNGSIYDKRFLSFCLFVFEMRSQLWNLVGLTLKSAD